jgi:hypothetical protein
MKINVDGNQSVIHLSTVEGYRKDNTLASKKKFSNRPVHMVFTGNDAPAKMVRAVMQKYGLTVEDL